jgi:hypothetical protein
VNAGIKRNYYLAEIRKELDVNDFLTRDKNFSKILPLGGVEKVSTVFGVSVGYDMSQILCSGGYARGEHEVPGSWKHGH